MNKLTKEQYLNLVEILAFEQGYLSLEEVIQDTRGKAIPFQKLIELINEHFDNPPLKFEEIHENMWVWDNKDKEWCKYISYQTFEYLDGYGSEFEENRFYRYEVKGESEHGI